MILELELTKDKKGNIVNERAANYVPSEAVRNRTGQVLQDFTLAYSVRHRPFTEFNDVSLTERLNIDRQSFNQFVWTEPRTAAEAWKSRAFRPIVRNKVITIAAQVTASLLFPKIYAENDNSEEEKDAEQVMRDLFEWAAEQSKYDRTFIDVVLAALVDPIAIINTEYCQKFREIKEITGINKWTKKKILDEIFSGFRDMVIPCEDIFIPNFYENDIQKQGFVIHRTVISYEQAKELYGDYENFQYVEPEIQFLYVAEQDQFYRVYDQNLVGRLVEKCVYYNHLADLKLTFINGILMDDVDNPNPRKDKLYPFATTGYEKFNARSFYYKSLVFKMGPDEEVINTLYRMIIDGTYVNIMPPSVIFGSEQLSSDVIAPGKVTTVNNPQPNSSWQTLPTNNNLAAGHQMLEKVEQSATETSVSNLSAGQALGGRQTAYYISALEQNAKTMLGLFVHMIGNLVQDFGYLRVNDILQYLTVGQAMDILNPNGRLKFHNFLIRDKNIGGINKSRRIRFDGNIPSMLPKEEIRDMQFGLMHQQKELNDNTEIMIVNPGIFRSLKYHLKIEPEALLPKSDATQKALMLEQYAMGKQDPNLNQKSMTRELFLGAYDKTKDDPDRFMVEDQNQPGQQPPPEGNAESAIANNIASQRRQAILNPRTAAMQIPTQGK